MATAISYKNVETGEEFLSLFPKRVKIQSLLEIELEKYEDVMNDLVVVKVVSTQHDASILRMELVHYLNTRN